MGHNLKCFCIICDKELELDTYSDLKKNGSVGMLHGGLICDTTGNYGSTIFDPITSPEKLEFYICDPCMLEKQDKVFYVKTLRTESHFEVETFKQHRRGYKGQKAKWGKAQEKLMEIIQAKGKDNIFIGYRALFHHVIYDVHMETGQEVVYEEKGFEFYFPSVKVGVKVFEDTSLFREQQFAARWKTTSGTTMVPACSHEVWMNSRPYVNLEEACDKLKKKLVEEIYRKLRKSNSSKS